MFKIMNNISLLHDFLLKFTTAKKKLCDLSRFNKKFFLNNLF